MVTTELSFGGGGLLAGATRRLGLGERTGLRALAFVAVAWLPLPILSAVQGWAFVGVRIPFLLDYGMYGRLLVAGPLLLLAEAPVRRRIGDVLRGFGASGLITPPDIPAFDRAVGLASRRIESLLPEIIALAAIYALTALRVRLALSDMVTTWYRADGGITLAGWYYALVSLPLFQLLLIRWVWRLAVWTALLWRVSRLDLRLLPIHPDGMGGLGFLTLGQIPFGLISFAGGCVISSFLMNVAAYRGGSPGDSVAPIVGYVILATLAIIAPALAFIDKLIALRAAGMLAYEDLGQRYAQGFHAKWVQGENPDNEPVLGSPDIQSLADLRNSFNIVQNLSIIPVDRKTVTVIAASAAIPMAPLLFTALPFEQIVARLLGFAG